MHAQSLSLFRLHLALLSYGTDIITDIRGAWDILVNFFTLSQISMFTHEYPWSQ